MSLRHPACSGCPLANTPSRLIPAIGPINAAIAVIGEAGGKDEARAGEPFVGAAGGILNTGLRMVGLEREACRIHNVLSCTPPNDWLVGAPYEYEAINHCRVHREPTLMEDHRVFLTVGATSSRVLLDQPKKGFVLDEWHSTVTPFGDGRWIIPTYHPAFLVHGNYNYMGAWLHAINLAKEVSRNGWVPDPITPIVDPDIETYRAWAKELQAMPDAWLAVDLETQEKMQGKAEDSLNNSSYNVVRINFAYHPDEGVTVPWAEPWHEVTRELLAGPSVKCFWNLEYDVPRLRAAGFKLGGKLLDFMDAWKVLQSDVPRGLGFVAPFYSKAQAWKHLSGVNPGVYAAIDPAQTLRCAHGIARDLQQEGRWEVFMRDFYTLDTRVLKPAEMAGVLIDVEALGKFSADLAAEDARMVKEMQALVPEEALPLVSGSPEKPSYTGWKKPPKDRGPWVEVTKTDKATGASIVRYYVRGEFNPDSGKHVLAYLKAKGLKPGQSKKGGGDSVDKLALDGLAKTDAVCALILKRRKITRVNSTYCSPTLVRIRAEGSDGRLHTTFTRTPSTMRLASVDPNMQNVVSR